MRVPHQTLPDGTEVFRAVLVGGPSDGLETLVTADRAVVANEDGLHVYDRGDDDRYYYNAADCSSSPLSRWLEYRDHAYGPEPLSDAQELETFRCFYAGMESAFRFLLEIGKQPGAAAIIEGFRATVRGEAELSVKLGIPAHIHAKRRRSPEDPPG